MSHVIPHLLAISRALFLAITLTVDPNADKIASSKLIKIAEIEPLVHNWTRCPKFFKLKGQITSSDERRILLRDESGDIEVQCKDSVTNNWTIGDIVELHAHANLIPMRRWSFYVKATDMKKLGHSPPPAPNRVSPGDIADGRFNYREVILTGVVTDAIPDDIDSRWNMLFLAKDGKRSLAMIQSKEVICDNLSSLIGAVVSIRGYCNPSSFMTRIIPFPHIITYTKGLSVITPAVTDPFAATEFQMTRESRIKENDISARQVISGTVIATWRNRSLFLKMENNERIEVSLGYNAKVPPISSSITASGFIKHNSYYTRMTHAAIRIDKKANGAREPAVATDMRQMLMLDGSKNGFGARLNGHAVCIKGKVMELHSIGTSDASLDIISNGHHLTVLIGEKVAPPPIGSVVSIAGICLFATETEDDKLGLTRLNGFSLIVRDSADITILSTPPWWTPQRLLILVGFLISLIAAMIWRNKRKEHLSLRESKLRIDERTRLAMELHDSLAQNLTGISLQLDAAEMAESENRTTALNHLANAREALRSCREGLRYCLSDLRSRSFEDSDMTEAITETIRPHIGMTQLAVRFNVPRALLSDSLAHAVLCIVRELAVNAVRHGHATAINVAGEYKDGQIRFSVRDNGSGFDPATRPGSDQGHFGLLGVNERINMFNGSLKIVSHINKGTKVIVTLNLIWKQPQF